MRVEHEALCHRTVPAILTARQLAAELGIAEVTLAKWRQAHKGPRYIRIARNLVRYNRADVDAWLAERRAA